MTLRFSAAIAIVAVLSTTAAVAQLRIPIGRTQLDSTPESKSNADDFPNNCDVPSRSFPSELRYYKNFHPSDSILDFFCNAQAISGSGTLSIEIAMNGRASQAHREPFNFDGTPKQTKRDFARLLTTTVQTYLGTYDGRASSRAIEPLSTFGIPAATPEGQRYIYNVGINVEFDGIEIAGSRFSVTGIYQFDLGTTAKWLRGSEKQLEFPVAVGQFSQARLIALPLAFRGMTLYSDDPKVQYSKDEVKNSISGKYSKFQIQPGRFTDKANAIIIDEGVYQRKPFLRISYTPNIDGPLDPKNGDADFKALSKEIADRYERGQKDIVNSKKGENLP